MNPQSSSAGPRIERKFFVVDGVPIVSLQSSGGQVKTLAYGAHGSHAYDWASGSHSVVEISEVEFWVRVCHAQSALERVAATRQ